MLSKFKQVRKNKLSLALSAALLGGMFATGTAQAVNLTQDGLGDAAIFQYYTAKPGWSTFIRLINTSDDPVAVKVRFREAANSREALDFILLLSPHDMWLAWTGNKAANGKPGLKTNDTSCLLPAPNTNISGSETWVQPNLGDVIKYAEFKSRAFQGDINDNGPAVADRLMEGHIEIIGIAQIKPDAAGLSPSALDALANLEQEITHGTNGEPSCNASVIENGLQALFNATRQNLETHDVDNVIAANAYILNISNGQGAGYDPTMLANFSDRGLIGEAYGLYSIFGDNAPLGIGSLQTPDMDNAKPQSIVLDDDGMPVASAWSTTGGYALNQENAAGNVPRTVVSKAMILSNAGNTTDRTVYVDWNGDGVCDVFPENAVPANAVSSLDGAYLAFGTNATSACNGVGPGPGTAGTLYLRLVNLEAQADAVGALGPANATVYANDVPARKKWVFPNVWAPVTGGVDAVSSLLMRNTVINEWAASNNQSLLINDHYKQWVLTFPTKHYYVDLQNGSNGLATATLVDPDADGPINDAFAPFTEEFDQGINPGKSCESFNLNMWDSEERAADATSPAPTDKFELCWETNVLSFNDPVSGTDYGAKGLMSSFNTSVNAPISVWPAGIDGKPSTYGWARLTFNGAGVSEGLSGHALNPEFYPGGSARTTGDFGSTLNKFTGLPVDGFLFSVYETGDVSRNHTIINDHKYERDITPYETIRDEYDNGTPSEADPY